MSSLTDYEKHHLHDHVYSKTEIDNDFYDKTDVDTKHGQHTIAIDNNSQLIGTINTQIPDMIKKDGSVRMTGNLEMGGFVITHHGIGTDANDLVNKSYIDTELLSKPNIGQTLLRDGSHSMSGNLNLGNNKITNCVEATSDDDCVTKKQLDSKLDRATFVISNSLPGVPVLDKISIALIPALSVITADSNDRVSSWVDPVNGVAYVQTNNSKKPLLKRDVAKKVFYLKFDGTDDTLKNPSFDVSKVAGSNGNTCTVIMVVKTKQQKGQSQFQWGKGNVRFGVHLPWSDGTLYVDFGAVSGGRLSIGSQPNLTGNIEVWTIRVDGTNMQLFRGLSITPIKSETISAILSGAAQEIALGFQIHSDGSEISFSEMDLYSFAVWTKAL